MERFAALLSLVRQAALSSSRRIRARLGKVVSFSPAALGVYMVPGGGIRIPAPLQKYVTY